MKRYDRLQNVRVYMKKNPIVEIVYKDNKTATFSVDRGGLNDKQVLGEAFRCVFLQIESKGLVREVKYANS